MEAGTTDASAERGGESPPAPPRPDTELVTASADGEDLPQRELDALTEFFLGNAPRAGADETDIVELEVDISAKGGRKWKCKVRPVSYGEWIDAGERGVFKGGDRDGATDSFKFASYIVARAVVSPNLARQMANLENAARMNDGVLPDSFGDLAGKHPPTDTAALLRIFFERMPGSLIQLNDKVLEMSRLSNLNRTAVKEVDAGKT